MFSLKFIVALIILSSAVAYVSRPLSMSFNLDKVVNDLSRNKILTKTSQLGLLTRLEKNGVKLSTAKPLLVLADDLDLLGVLEASSDKVLPLIAKGIELAPSLLPLAATAIKIPSSTLAGGAVLSLLSAVAVLAAIPDDSIGNVALQTALVVPLGAILPGALGVGSVIVSKLLEQQVKPVRKIK